MRSHVRRGGTSGSQHAPALPPQNGSPQNESARKKTPLDVVRSSYPDRVATIEDKPTITVLFSIGLMNPANGQVLRDVCDELNELGYETALELRPPSGQFSASLEQILLAISATGGLIVAKKVLELAAEDAYKATKRAVGKLVKRKRSVDGPEPESAEAIESVPVVITVEVNGKQVKNVLVKGPADITELPTRPDFPHGHQLGRPTDQDRR